LKIQTTQNDNSLVGNTEKFYQMMTSLHGKRSQKVIRAKGEFFEEFGIEVISIGGNVNFYFRVWSQSLNTLKSAAKLYFPTVNLEEVSDPLIEFPRSINMLSDVYSKYEFGEFKLVGGDLFPTKYQAQLDNPRVDFNTNPVNQLVEQLETVQEGDAVVIQYNFRPMDTGDAGKKKEWEKKLTKLRKELSSNASVELDDKGRVAQFTRNELDLLEGVEKKITSPCFETKIRFGLFGKTITGKRYLGGVMNYFKNFATSKQAVIPAPKSWDESPNPLYGYFLDKIFWGPEIKKRQWQMYNALLGRSMGSGGETQFWDIFSLSTFIHIPTREIGGEQTVTAQLESKEEKKIEVEIVDNKEVIYDKNLSEKISQPLTNVDRPAVIIMSHGDVEDEMFTSIEAVEK
jgi:hypothetical protein